MTNTDLPDENDPTGIFEFAMSFDGYEHFGSFEASAAAACSGDRSTLALVRNELFFAARASRQVGEGELAAVYRELRPFFRRHVSIRLALTHCMQACIPAQCNPSFRGS